ncbi:DnaJ subfamily C member 11 [Nymphon striatum]|nr:DnaJ subfamily C member 11 [Nymphon striatum]
MSHEGDIENTERWLEDDFYSFLNVSSEATDSDISNAFRKLSKMYHPDKHSDPVKKKEAEMMFNKIKVAYEVLSDPHKRAIYDTVGTKGLETVGWEVVQRTKTPQEIREEYERLATEQEERRLQQRTNPKGNLIVSVNATDLFESYSINEYQNIPQIEINQMSISQSVEAPLTATDTLTLGGSLTSQNGNGAGTVHCSLRRALPSASWVEFDVGAGNGLNCSLKGVRPLGKFTHISMAGSLQFIPYGIKPGFQTVISRHLDKNVYGTVTWKALNQSAMCTTLVWDKENYRLAASCQVGILLGTHGATFEYGCEKKISSNSIVGATMSIGVPSGVMLKISDSDNSDVDYEPMESDNETIDSYESDDVDLSEHEDDGVMLSDSWKKISDIFSDCRPNSLPELVRNFSAVNPALNCNANNSVLDCFKKFITNDVIVLSCDRIARSAGATPLVLKGVNRANQDFIFPIMLSEEIMPISIFYGTVGPLIAWYAVTALIINPHLRRQKLKDVEKKKEANAHKIAKRRAEAETSISLMQETVNRAREQEIARQGVIILQALYGKLVQDTNSVPSSESEVIDVKIPLQCLVTNSKLILHGETKSNLPGFYDPCIGEKKKLYVQYKFHNDLHEVCIEDDKPLRIPHRTFHKKIV